MSTPESRRGTLPKFAVFGGLALAAASASCLTGVAATAHAAPSTPAAPVNGPIAYTTHDARQALTWHTVNPDGSGDAALPVGDMTAYDGSGAGSRPDILNGDADSAVYSPDGTRVVFRGVNGCMYLADADGTGALSLTGCETVGNFHQVPVISPPLAAAYSAVWSSDSKSLYVADAVTGVITAVSADGSAQTTFAAKVPANYRLTSVSPAGALALITAGVPRVAILDPGKTAPRDLTSGLDAQFSAATGKLLVVDPILPPPATSGVNVPTVFSVDATTGARTQLTDPNVDYVGAFCWSPDGTSFAYSTSEKTGGASIYSRAAVAGGPRALVVHTADQATMVTSWHNGPITSARAADRLAGADRIETAVHVSQWSYDKHGAGGRQANVAVLSRSDQFADALGGSALAAQKGGPLLLTPTAALDDRAKAELTRVLGPGATVYVLGGTSALSPAVEQSIRDLGFVPQRLQGPDRFSTATTIAAAVSSHPHTVMVATGRNFPDALAAGAAAAQDPNGGVVILSDDAALPAPVKTYLSGIDPTTTNVYAVGGQGKAALAAGFPSWRPTPLAGNDRYETAELVAKSPLFSGPIGSVGLATGSAWPDALSGGALIATQHGPLLLTPPAGAGDQLPQVERDLVVALAPHLSNVVVFGGPNAVVSGLEMNTATVAFGANHFFTYANRVSPTVAGPR